MQVDFVKGHCGWDAVTLVPAGAIPPDRELEAALTVLDPPYLGGLEVGYLEPGERPAEIRLRVVDSTARGWISMCGGMTQVIGKALVETFLRERFPLPSGSPVETVRLITPSGAIPIEIEREGDRWARTTTVMDQYAHFLYREGVRPLELDGVEVLETGDFVVVGIGALERRHAGIDFTRRDPGDHLDVVNGLLRAFQRHRGQDAGVCGMLYDERPDGPGQFRVFPRFLGPNQAAAAIPYEFQCGTGSIAVAIALAQRGELPFRSGRGEVVLEWGNLRVTPDPYGIRTSRLALGVGRGTVTEARFSHSVVEILAQGRLFLAERSPAARLPAPM